MDYDFIPLLVNQAYVDVLARAPVGTPASQMARLARAAECMSDGDVISDYIRSRQAWGLLPSLALATTRTATFAAGPAPFLSFPTWLGKNSSRGKRARLLAELALHVAPHVSGGREALRLDYLDHLRTGLFAPLAAPGTPDDPAPVVDAVINMLDAYGMSRADMMETLTEVAFAPPPDPGAAAMFVDWSKSE